MFRRFLLVVSSLLLGSYFCLWLFKLMYAGMDNCFRSWKPVYEIVFCQTLWVVGFFVVVPFVFLFSYLLLKRLF